MLSGGSTVSPSVGAHRTEVWEDIPDSQSSRTSLQSSRTSLQSSRTSLQSTRTSLQSTRTFTRDL
ncbi:hypothetical protein EYF80_064132 [Liparis tanakae]|uniref:Uncharacterized protein n=1 Tax=Liparis tanakae TaxID=230148 RepID=A0A4Z2EA36_9TELE|nr:hypothetical protein EYF80_064132 [Liparis tanakae]